MIAIIIIGSSLPCLPWLFLFFRYSYVRCRFSNSSNVNTSANTNQQSERIERIESVILERDRTESVILERDRIERVRLERDRIERVRIENKTLEKGQTENNQSLTKKFERPEILDKTVKSDVQKEIITKREKEAKESKEKIRALEKEKECKICMDKEVEVIFIPCGHIVCCAQCGENFNCCPVCKQEIVYKNRIFTG